MEKNALLNGEKKAVIEEHKITCGLIMPISNCDDYSTAHWLEVKDIISECVTQAGFYPKLVSEATETGIIHQRIVENIYANPIVVCDISSRNPNVMFELGIRLTFDKPVVIIRDDMTDRIFDTDIIEYLEYPKSLRYSSIQVFKQKLIEKITATHERYKHSDSSFFIKNFKNVKAQKLQDEELNSTQLILRAIADLKRDTPASINQQAEFSISEPLINHISNDMLVKTFEYCFNSMYGKNFTEMKNHDEKLLKENLGNSFGKTIIRNSFSGVSISILYKRLNDLYKLIQASDNYGEVILKLSHK
ncbi:hypothetical protein ACPPVU_06685 [Mucilaginibacter sp. McL0603]|uniref:hypothetical protein n=1 Tax=Mucilaginibacter sp. McL0603 TaxID=3415670 RepID=UPI003CF4EB97